KLTKEKYEYRKEKLSQYQKKKATLEQQIKELKANLKTKERIGLAVVEEELQKSREAYETALKKWEQIKSVLQNLLQLISDMKETATNTAAIEKEVSKWLEVYDMISGQNAKKISFERFLQIDYLDQIIYAANERFIQLLYDKLYYMRSESQESYDKYRG